MAMSEYVVLIMIWMGKSINGGITFIEIWIPEVVLFDEILLQLIEFGG